MSCKVKILFISDSLGDYSDTLTVLSESGVINVGLFAQRERPELTLEPLLEIGSCLIGQTITRNFNCFNNGGPAKFKFEFNDQEEQQQPENFLSIKPSEFELNKNQQIVLEASFTANIEVSKP